MAEEDQEEEEGTDLDSLLDALEGAEYRTGSPYFARRDIYRTRPAVRDNPSFDMTPEQLAAAQKLLAETKLGGDPDDVPDYSVPPQLEGEISPKDLGSIHLKSVAAVNEADLPDLEKEALEDLDDAARATAMGQANADTSDFDSPMLLSATNEEHIRKGNASIRLGKDRYSHILSGYGGKGNSHCAAIDLVAGHMGWLAKKRTKNNKVFYVNPNFKIDSARVYISQKADIDNYFELAEGSVGNSDSINPRSAVAIKADNVRIIARENIKLVTRPDRKNSQGGDTSNMYKTPYGIDLIGMNDSTDMQPLVKGENLVMCLDQIIELVEILATILQNFFDYDRQFKQKVIEHTHISPFYGKIVPPDFNKLLIQGVQAAVQIALNCEVPLQLDFPLDLTVLKNDYLSNEGGAVGDRYILSKYNSTN